jgi:hypothetical protein
MTLAASTRDGLRFERHDRQIIRHLPRADNRVESRRKHGILGSDARRIKTLVPVVIGARSRPKRTIFVFKMRIVIPKRDQSSSADRHRIGAQRQALRHIGAVTDTAGDNQLHLAMHAEFLQRPYRGHNG